MDTPLLWHIPLSHFNEKVRWALDYKCIRHRRKVLGPDYLVRAWRARGRGTLPILFLEGRAISDRRFDADHRRTRRSISRTAAVSW